MRRGEAEAGGSRYGVSRREAASCPSRTRAGQKAEGALFVGDRATNVLRSVGECDPCARDHGDWVVEHRYSVRVNYERGRGVVEVQFRTAAINLVHH